MIHYGFSVAFWNVLDSQSNRIGICPDAISNKKDAVILNWLTKRFQYLVSDLQKQSLKNALDRGPFPLFIWICWWDGIDAMPPIVRACYNSVLKHANKYQVKLITKDTLKDFITLPDHITEKVKTGKMTLTHLSDIIRMALLSEHGGLWLDATILVTNTIQPGDAPFFTIKRDFGGKYVSKRRWTVFCIGGHQNNILFNFMKEFYYDYWKKYDEIIDYFLFDYAIALAYNASAHIRSLIDSMGKNNPNLYVLQDNLDNEFSTNVFEAVIKDTMFHKLTWKKERALVTPANKLTFYGYILEKNI
jgi:hypothetical protein